MLINNDFINKILDNTNVSEIISHYINIKKKGYEFIALCPFHNEKSPSFTINDNKGFYHCFGCGEHGNIINFISKIDNSSFSESIEKICSILGIKIIYNEDKSENHNTEYDIMNLIKEKLHKNFYHNDIAIKYCEFRKINTHSIKKFQLGDALGKQDIYKFLLKKNVNIKTMEKLGLVRKDNNNNNIFDYFSNRIIFPIHNINGQTIGFGGRSYDKNNKCKYLNSPESNIFIKSKVLYGLNFAKQAARKNNKIILVEGYIDCIAMHQHGFTNTVATLGTAINKEQLKILWKLCDVITCCFDGDIAGYKAMIKTIELSIESISAKTQINFVIMENNKDPADILNIENGMNKMQSFISNAKTVPEIIINNLEKEFGKNSIDSINAIHSAYIQKINQIKDYITRYNYKNFFYIHNNVNSTNNFTKKRNFNS